MKSRKKKENVDVMQEMQAIRRTFDSILVMEIIWSSMKCLKNNPKLNIPEAIECGINEWIK